LAQYLAQFVPQNTGGRRGLRGAGPPPPQWGVRPLAAKPQCPGLVGLWQVRAATRPEMRLCGKVSNFGLAVGTSIWVFYSVVELQHFYDTAVKVPPTQRVSREVPELRLPTLYFCPADRGRASGFQWHSYDCKLSYREEHRSCPARLEAYTGREPEEFRGPPDGEGMGKANKNGGQCLEFGTHMIGVREEYSAAWNEVTLRAAFHPPSVEGLEDALQEMELGYLSVEWEVGQQDSTTERYYYPLLRVPFFFLPETGYESGVATRLFLAKEVDRGLTAAGKYWYTYGAMQIAVVNASMPEQSPPGAPYIPPQKLLGVVHVVITLEDFELYTFQVISGFFPLMATVGQIAGVGALVAFILTGPRLRTGENSKSDEAGQSCSSPTGGPEYARVLAPDDDDGSGDEQQALLSTEATRESRSRSEDRLGGQALLGTEEGMDGL